MPPCLLQPAQRLPDRRMFTPILQCEQRHRRRQHTARDAGHTRRDCRSSSRRRCRRDREASAGRCRSAHRHPPPFRAGGPSAATRTMRSVRPQSAVWSTHDHASRALSSGTASERASLGPLISIRASMIGPASVGESLCRSVSAAIALKVLFGGSPGASMRRLPSLRQSRSTTDSDGALRSAESATRAQHVGSRRLCLPGT